MDYDTMPAGPELDRMVAERVMGWRPYTAAGTFLDELGGIHNTHPSAHGGLAFHPSEKIAHAWEVVEQMIAKRVHLDIISIDDGWMAGDGGKGYADEDGCVSLDLRNHAKAETAPLAICRAALKAVAP